MLIHLTYFRVDLEIKKMRLNEEIVRAADLKLQALHLGCDTTQPSGVFCPPQQRVSCEPPHHPLLALPFHSLATTPSPLVTWSPWGQCCWRPRGFPGHAQSPSALGTLTEWLPAAPLVICTPTSQTKFFVTITNTANLLLCCFSLYIIIFSLSLSFDFKVISINGFSNSYFIFSPYI